ncbi:anti-sigma factor family protein [Candidatus Latescibacterota bacterium]
MKCRQVQKYLDAFLIERPDEELRSELVEHIVNCPRCAREYELARQTLTSIRLSHKVQASTDLKKRIMGGIREMKENNLLSEKRKVWSIIRWKPALVAVAAVFLLVIASIFILFDQNEENLMAPQMLSQAWAAEEALFTGDEVIHIVNEIIVYPISDPVLSQIRWFPVVSIEATGKPKFHQLTLSAEPGEGYTVKDEAWFDNSAGRFIRLFSEDGIPVFANSYDGEAVYSLETGSNGNGHIVSEPTGKEFHPPENPVDFLGIAAGLSNTIDEKDVSLIKDVVDGKLKDGSKARFLKMGFPSDDSIKMPETYWIYKIRESDGTIAEMEWIVNKESLMVVRRLTTKTADINDVPWNLAGMDNLANASPEPPKASIRSDTVIPNVSVRHMIEKADFETYIFTSNPPWTGQFEITDILDIVSPPHRSFSISYRAEDGRHVVLMQSHSFNETYSKLTKVSKLKYTSPNGVKVWSGLQNNWLAKILLTSSRSTIKDPPSEDCVAYIIESPDGTFPCIAINGKLSDDEFHDLIDRLVPAKEYAAN